MSPTMLAPNSNKPCRQQPTPRYMPDEHNRHNPAACRTKQHTEAYTTDKLLRTAKVGQFFHIHNRQTGSK